MAHGRSTHTGTTAAAPIAGALTELLASPVSEVRRLTGGASRETWSFAAGGNRFILQRRVGGPGLDAQPADMAAEAALVRAAARCGVPVAEVVAACGDEGLPRGAAALGDSWIVLAHVDGETIARRLLRDAEWAGARETLLQQAAGALAAIHRIPPGEVPHLNEPDPVARFRSALDFFGEPHPALELGLRWLDQSRPARSERCVVHGDFRLGNWIVGPDGLRAVIDWELAHLGDPAEDLGWMCVRAWRFGRDEPAAGLGSRQDLLDAYRAAGGRPVDAAALRWWEAFGTLAWGVMCIAQANRHRSGTASSVELAAIGRRTCENEHDLLALLPGPGCPAPTSPQPPTALPHSPHDLPGAAELLGAVSTFLRQDVMAATEGQVQFHTRVAANVVDQVRRQFELGAAHAARHRDRLRRLGFEDDASLASAIRRGELDDRFDEIKVPIWEAVLDKLAVAHPGYANLT